MKKIILFSVACVFTSAVFAETPNTANMNISNVTLNSSVPFVWYKFGYDSSCQQLSGGYYCGGDATVLSSGTPAAVFNAFKPILLHLFSFSYVTNASDFAGGMQPYLQFGYSTTQTGARIYPSSCAVPMSAGGSYAVTISSAGCQITP